MRRKRVLAAIGVFVAFFASDDARAEGAGGGPIVVWPSMTPAGDEASPIAMHRPKETEAPVAARAQELDATLRDAVQDLGFTLDVADPGPSAGHTRDTDLVERATQTGRNTTTGSWVVSARVEYLGSDMFLVRIVAVPPKGKELRVRAETVKGEDVSARGLVMLRDLLSPTAAAQAEASEIAREHFDASARYGMMSTLHSPGKAVLAVNSGLFGAYVAYSVQRASGSDDPRVLYPLLALGAGVGIGSALLVSDEWDISTGDAWVLAAGAWWGAGAGVLIANGRHVQPLGDRYAWGVGSGLTGLGLATFALTRGKMDEGDAVLAHSGGALGMFVGSLTDLAYRGSLDNTPYTGAGYGSAIGLLAAGTLATQVTASPSRLLLIDLGMGLGGLAGAAGASPLLFGEENKGRTRAFLGATLGGSLAGGTLAWLLTRNSAVTPPKQASWLTTGLPTVGVIGASATSTGSVPAYGIGYNGRF